MICNPTKCYSGDEMRRMKWTGHVARMGKGEICTGIWWGKPDVKKLIRKQGVVGRIILRWIYRKCNVRHGMDRTGSG